ncbi:MAG: FAD:protein FMN transferase, partial [Gammaproteobacteria bacterium]
MPRARVWLNIFFAAAAALFSQGCAEPRTERAAEIFGTKITITILNLPEAQAAAAIGDALAHMENMHRRFHAWRPGELHALNQIAAAGKLPATVSAPMAAMLSQSAEYSRRSEGLFNPAAGGLFRLWGFHADTPPKKPPSAAAVSVYLAALPDMRNIKMRGQVLQSAPDTAQFDFGGIAKGAALDAAKKILLRRGVKNALINVGGNIMALGKNGKRQWRILLHPAGRRVELKDGEAAATSGDSQRFFIYEGRRYHHIIDPRTGNPAQNASAASAISDDAQNAGA